MAMVCSESFTVGGEPRANDLILCTREENIPVFRVSFFRSEVLSTPVVFMERAHLIWVRDRSWRIVS